jgi:hypothetical protein
MIRSEKALTNQGSLRARRAVSATVCHLKLAHFWNIFWVAQLSDDLLEATMENPKTQKLPFHPTLPDPQLFVTPVA